MSMCSDAQKRKRIDQLLQMADLGVTGIEVRERDVDESTRKMLAAVLTALPEGMSPPELPEKMREPQFHHKCAHGKSVTQGGEFESAGTMVFFGLIGPVITALDSGGVLCVDELDSSLHPLLSLELVKLFNDPARNHSGAQLIFNTHDTNLLDPEVLRRDQVWFTEKDNAGATHLYPLTDFKPRRGENLKRGYLEGRYGAVPFLGSLSIVNRDVSDAD
jgi:hypothetical protein